MATYRASFPDVLASLRLQELVAHASVMKVLQQHGLVDNLAHLLDHCHNTVLHIPVGGFLFPIRTSAVTSTSFVTNFTLYYIKNKANIS